VQEVYRQWMNAESEKSWQQELAKTPFEKRMDWTTNCLKRVSKHLTMSRIGMSIEDDAIARKYSENIQTKLSTTHYHPHKLNNMHTKNS
jgi:hypothetical protein